MAGYRNAQARARAAYCAAGGGNQNPPPANAVRNDQGGYVLNDQGGYVLNT